MSREAGSPVACSRLIMPAGTAPLVAGDLDLVGDLRGLRARDGSLAFGFALRVFFAFSATVRTPTSNVEEWACGFHQGPEHIKRLTAALEILYRAFMLLGCRASLECSKIAALARPRIFFSRVQSVFARRQLADHW